MSNIAEGFERLHGRGSCAEVRSLLYVVADNYPALSEQAASLRDEVRRTGKLLTGLIQSTQRRKNA